MKSSIKQRYGGWALITGATGGIGLAFARQLAAEGVHCILISNEPDQLQAIAKDLQAQHGVQCRSVHLDLSEPGCGDAIARLDEIGQVGIVVNAAAYGRMGFFIQHELQDYLHMMRLNEHSVMEITHLFCRQFYSSQKRGCLINVSSANAEFQQPIPFSAVYSAGKSFLKHFTEAVAFEMQPFGIDLLNVSCGPTNTQFQDRAKTNRLSFCESPADVARLALRAVGRCSSITTNPVARLGIRLVRLAPVSRKTKIAGLAYYFGQILGKQENCSLPPLGLERPQASHRIPFLARIFGRIR